jgi:hypothetical protein
MTRLAALLAVLMLFIMLALSGCTSSPYQYNEGSDVWTWSQKGSVSDVLLNGKIYAEFQNNISRIYLPDGRSLNVTVNKDGTQGVVTMQWSVATTLTAQEYGQVNTAFSVYNAARSQKTGGSVGWVIFLLIVVLAGILLFIYAAPLVNSWKLGGIFSGNDTAKSLLIFKTLGILLIVVGAVILLAVIF